MLQLGIELASKPPVIEVAGKDTVTMLTLHHRGSNGLQHHTLQSSNGEPWELGIGTVAATMLSSATGRSHPYKHEGAVPFRQLAGLSIARVAIDMEAKPGNGRPPQYLKAQRTASFAFVQDATRLHAVEPRKEDSRVSMNGVARLVVWNNDKKGVVACQHLIMSDEETVKYPVRYATPSLASRGKTDDIWLALRPMHDADRFVETLVSYEELRDTLSLRD